MDNFNRRLFYLIRARAKTSQSFFHVETKHQTLLHKIGSIWGWSQKALQSSTKGIYGPAQQGIFKPIVLIFFFTW
jgi:hypothetical protein